MTLRSPRDGILVLNSFSCDWDKKKRKENMTEDENRSVINIESLGDSYGFVNFLCKYFNLKLQTLCLWQGLSRIPHLMQLSGISQKHSGSPCHQTAKIKCFRLVPGPIFLLDINSKNINQASQQTPVTELMSELISWSVTLPSSVVYRSDSSGPQRASFCSAGLLSRCWQHCAAPRGWCCGPEDTSKTLKVKEKLALEATCFIVTNSNRACLTGHVRTCEGIKMCDQRPSDLSNCLSATYQIFARMFPAVAPLLSIVDLKQQAI